MGGSIMKVTEPIFITKTEKRGYAITSSLPGYGTLRRYGRSEEEAKEKFFVACGKAGSERCRGRSNARSLGISPRRA
jgi:hypothetical protein